MPSLWLKSVVHPSALTASPALGVVGVLECIPAVLRWTWVTPWTSSPLGQHSERDKELDTVTEQYSKINSTGSAVGFTVMGQFNSQLSPLSWEKDSKSSPTVFQLIQHVNIRSVSRGKMCLFRRTRCILLPGVGAAEVLQLGFLRSCLWPAEWP